MTEESPVNPVEENTGIVLYCDGSARPNPGNIGFGFHGYKFRIEEPKKGTGLHTQVLTSGGYVPSEKKEGVKQITPLAYYDGFGASQMISTNNVAELLAASNAIATAIDSNAKKVLIKTDSEYVIKGIKDWSPSWIRNRWYKQDGSPVPHQDKWKKVLSNINTLTDKGASFDIKWVKGHTDVHGNIIADKLAVIGCMNSKMGHEKVQITTSQPEGYWKDKNEKNPLLHHRTLFFNTLRHSHVPGEYFLGNHSKDEDFIGKKTPEAAYAVIRLETPEVPLELVRKYQTDMSGNFDSMVMLHTDVLYSKSHSKDIEDYGVACLVQPDFRRLDLSFIDRERLSRELRPPKLASRAIETLSFLKGMLNDYKRLHIDKLPELPKDPLSVETPSFTVIDITDAFYVKEEKPNKAKKTTEVITKLKDSLAVGVKTVAVTATVDGAPLELKLILGIDVAERNSLKRIEASSPSIELLIWKESDTMVRYATVIRSANDYGIWCGFYSNLVALPKMEGKKSSA